MAINLSYTKLDFILGDTQNFQVEEGFFFCFKSSIPQRLYVRFPQLGIEVTDAVLPDSNIMHIIAVNRNLFFNTSNRKIFKAVTDEFGNIRIHFVRDLQINATIPRDGICIRTIDGAKRALRMADNPSNSKGIMINTVDEIGQVEIKGIHRGKLIFLDYCGPNKSASVKMEDNAIFLELPLVVPNSCLFAQDCSYFYVCEKNKVFVINTETIQILPVLAISGITDIRVIGGNKNAIVFTGNEDGTNFLMTSKIPTDYFLKPTTEDSIGIPTDPNSDWTREAILFEKQSKQENGLTAGANNKKKKKKKRCRFDDWQERRKGTSSTESVEKHETLDKWQTEMSNSINDLLDKNAELSKLIEDAKRKEDHSMLEPSSITDEMLHQFRASNCEMEEENNRLDVDIQQLGENINRTAALNRDIETANSQLMEEKAMMLLQEKEEDESQCGEMNILRQERAVFTHSRDELRAATLKKQAECIKILDENEELEKQLERIEEENRKLSATVRERNKILQIAKKKMDNMNID